MLRSFAPSPTPLARQPPAPFPRCVQARPRSTGWSSTPAPLPRRAPTAGCPSPCTAPRAALGRTRWRPGATGALRPAAATSSSLRTWIWGHWSASPWPTTARWGWCVREVGGLLLLHGTKARRACDKRPPRHRRHPLPPACGRRAPAGPGTARTWRWAAPRAAHPSPSPAGKHWPVTPGLAHLVPAPFLLCAIVPQRPLPFGQHVLVDLLMPTCPVRSMWLSKERGDGLAERDLFPGGSPHALKTIAYKARLGAGEGWLGGWLPLAGPRALSGSGRHVACVHGRILSAP